MAKKIVMVVGSLRGQSLNLQLAKKVEQMLAGKVDVSYLSYADIPYMNQDNEFPAPAEVERVRKEIMDADGIWFVTPEYNASYPGVLKNLLDWLSRPIKSGDLKTGTAIFSKKATICGASGKSGAAGAIKNLKELLIFMGLDLLQEPMTGVALGSEAFQTNLLILSLQDIVALEAQTKAFLKSIGVS